MEQYLLGRLDSSLCTTVVLALEFHAEKGIKGLPKEFRMGISLRYTAQYPVAN